MGKSTPDILSDTTSQGSPSVHFPTTTESIRDSIIDHLIREKYMERDGRNLVPTTKAENLFEFLQAIQAEDLTQPALTGDWEYRLKEMEQGRLERESFMEDIRSMTKDIVEKIRAVMEAPPPELPDLDAVCPACGGAPLTQTEDHYSCPGCRYRPAVQKSYSVSEEAQKE